MASDRILYTKLVMPHTHAQLVLRPRFGRLEEAARVVLVCAPAGYGKSTLAASWAQDSTHPVAWLSLDEGDNDPQRFLMHLIAALSAHVPSLNGVMAEVLASQEPPNMAGLMRPLVNQLCGISEPLCLVLDDLHTIENPQVHEAIAFVIDHNPPKMRIVIATRAYPPFSLARLRGQGQLQEFGAEHLRFTLEETQIFCNQMRGLDLPAEQVRKLESRTEGWLVGLQLAADSLQGQPDKAAFIDSFAGDDRHITEFLMDEVLRARSEKVQRFLLHTSVLDRFNAALCDELLDCTDARDMIDALERSNLFVFGLDRQRLWYRYHHLFASLLQSRLQAREPSAIADIFRRASVWFETNDLHAEAIQYAIKAKDYDRAADLMERHSRALFSHGRFGTALAWCRQLPDSWIAKRPVLAVTCAWACFYNNDLLALENYLRLAERALQGFQEAPQGSPGRVMLGQVALMRGCMCAHHGEVERAHEYQAEALRCFSPGRLLYDAAAVCLGVCMLASNRVPEAQGLFGPYIARIDPKRDAMVPVHASFGMARIHLLKGELALARQVYETALRASVQNGWEDLPVCGMLHLGLGELDYFTNDLSRAELRLLKGIEMTADGMQYTHTWGRVMLALVRHAQGCPTTEAELKLDDALWKYAGRFIVEIAPLSAAIGKLWLAQGRPERVQQWAANFVLPGSLDALPPEREAEYVVLAHSMIYGGRYDEAMRLLAVLERRAYEGDRRAVALEIAVLQALALHRAEDEENALAALQRATELVECTGLISPFLETPELGGLLHNLAKQQGYRAQAGNLLRHFRPHLARPAARPLLSKKEQLVASYVLKGFSNKEIAEAMFVSRNTLNSHMKSLYAKLDVKTRLQAIDRLSEWAELAEIDAPQQPSLQ